MANDVSEEFERTTLKVYLYVAKEGKPVGPRDVMRGAHLSSPSVAYRHLQKLEDSGLLTKNEYGAYLLKRKMKIHGFHWIRRSLVPNAMFYFYFFLGLFITEIIVLALHWTVEGFDGKVFFAIGLSITGIAMVLLLIEALSSSKRLGKPSTHSQDE